MTAPLLIHFSKDVMRILTRELRAGCEQVMLCISLVPCDGERGAGEEEMIHRTFLRRAGGKDSKSASDILSSRAIAYEASP